MVLILIFSGSFMAGDNDPKSNYSNKIEYYFLRISAERFSSDLYNFSKEIHSFSDEQLFALVSFYDHARDNIAKVKQELERRLDVK